MTVETDLDAQGPSLLGKPSSLRHNGERVKSNENASPGCEALLLVVSQGRYCDGWAKG